MFYHNGKTLSNTEEIANAFNVYFPSIGQKLASEIEENINNTADYTNYISMLLSIETLFHFKCITDKDTRLAIDKLENKSISSHDGISNKLQKLLKFELSKSLTLIINQIITTGVFLDLFKISKIIPLFKMGDCSLLSSYRTIFLLPRFLRPLQAGAPNRGGGGSQPPP